MCVVLEIRHVACPLTSFLTYYTMAYLFFLCHVCVVCVQYYYDF